MIKLLKHLKPIEWLQFFAVICLVVGTVAIDMALPEYMAEIISQVGAGAGVNEILITGAIMLALCFGSIILSGLAGFFSAHISAGLCQTVRQKLFDKVGSFSMQEIERFSTASLITRSTNDITQLQQTYAIGIRMIFTAPVMAIWALCKIIDKSSELSGITAIFLVIMVAGIMALFLFAFPRFKKLQSKVDKLNLVTRENLTGIRVVRAYNAEEKQLNKFEDANTDFSKTNLFLNRLMALLSPFMTIVMSGLSLTLVWIGAYLIGENLLNVPVLMEFTQYSALVLMSFVMLSLLFLILPRASVSARRVREVLDSQTTIADGSNDFKEKGLGKLEFKNVCFRYPDAKDPVLKKINFSLNKGETLAIIGSTGSGKSTIINLIMRFYDTTKGKILIDNQDIKDIKLEQLYDRIGYIPQKSLLFSGTVFDNVAYGTHNASKEDIDKAIEISQAKEFVEKLDGKTDFMVSQGGNNLSGGQKQRLSIARAIAKNPEFLLFDDSFSALDFATDKKLRTALKENMKDATKVIVAQRIGTVMDADKILVLNEGNVIGLGTHKELMQTCNVYRELAYSQLSKEDLES